MRFVVFFISTLFLVPLGMSSEAEPRDALEVSTWTVDDASALSTWSPAPGALGYLVFRGETTDTAQLIGESATTSFFDATAPAEDAWYVIQSIHPGAGWLDLGSPSRGACIKHRGATGLSITTAHCLPVRPY
jgi:hypothetical protein